MGVNIYHMFLYLPLVALVVVLLTQLTLISGSLSVVFFWNITPALVGDYCTYCSCVWSLQGIMI